MHSPCVPYPGGSPVWLITRVSDNRREGTAFAPPPHAVRPQDRTHFWAARAHLLTSSVRQVSQTGQTARRPTGTRPLGRAPTLAQRAAAAGGDGAMFSLPSARLCSTGRVGAAAPAPRSADLTSAGATADSGAPALPASCGLRAAPRRY